MKEIQERIEQIKKYISENRHRVINCAYNDGINIGLKEAQIIYSKKIDNLITIIQMLSMQKKVTKSDWNRFMKKLEEMK